jgi:hypothetical protein
LRQKAAPAKRAPDLCHRAPSTSQAGGTASLARSAGRLAFQNIFGHDARDTGEGIGPASFTHMISPSLTPRPPRLSPQPTSNLPFHLPARSSMVVSCPPRPALLPRRHTAPACSQKRPTSAGAQGSFDFGGIYLRRLCLKRRLRRTARQVRHATPPPHSPPSSAQYLDDSALKGELQPLHAHAA